MLSLGIPATLHAQVPDVVEVATGEQLKGDIDRLYRSRLEFRTSSAGPGRPRFAGTISIRWSEVVKLTSAKMVDVELVSGEYFVGSISTPTPGMLVVQTASGPSKPIEFNQIVWMLPIDSGFGARLTGSVDFGLNYVYGDNARAYSLNAAAEHRSPAHRYENDLTFESSLAVRDDAESLTRNELDYALVRRMARRWFAVAMAEGHQDATMDLDARFLVGGAIGRRLVHSNRSDFSLMGGVDYDAERYSGFDGYDQSAEALIGINWDWFDPGGSTEALIDAQTYFGLDRKRVRVDWDATVRRDFFWDLYWAVNFFDRYDSDPPHAEPNRDLGVAVTLGWTF